jgi:two-component system, cell cycle sensor histidine kinase and response regulator CckA
MSAATPFPSSLGNAETELRRLFENAPFGVAYCGRQGNIAAMNPALDRMVGGEDQIARYFNASGLIDPQDRGENRRLFRELFDGERENFEFRGKPADAGDNATWWTAWRVRGVGDKPDYALVIAEETTEESRETVQRLDDDRLAIMGRLTGGVAHDFNNLLTGVLLYCELLIAGLEQGNRLHTYAEQIRSATIQATGLVGQLLRVMRPDRTEACLLSLNDLIEGMRTLLVRLIGENVELKLRLDPNLGLVKMEPTQVQQILLNLVLNARDAMPDGGQVTIETSNSNVQILTREESAQSGVPLIPCALFVVADNGEGMDATTRNHLFEPFFTTKPAGKGNGLGLNTVHHIVSTSGGLLHIDSDKISGTRVSILLPLVPDAVLPNPTPNDSQSRPNEGVLPPIQKE